MRKLLVLFCLVVFAGTACQKKTVDLLNTPLMTVAQARAAMLHAPDELRSTRTAAIESATHFEFQGSPVTLHGHGAADFARGRSVFKLDFGKFFAQVGAPKGTPTSFDYIFTPSRFYIGIPPAPKGKRYASIAREAAPAITGALLGGGGGVADPADTLAPLRGITGPVQFVATESVHGARASEYHVTIDPGIALRTASRTQQTSVRQMFLGLGVQVPASVWVGPDRRVYRIAFVVGGADSRTSFSADLFDYGTSPGVALPPASRVAVVKSAAEFRQLFHAALEGAGSPGG